jgi:Regulator of chromosome condensation (RCC1) repeat
MACLAPQPKESSGEREDSLEWVDSRSGDSHPDSPVLESTFDSDSGGSPDSDSGTPDSDSGGGGSAYQDWVAVSAGDEFACGLHADGTISCWGGDLHGETSPPSGSFTAVAAMAYTACAVQADGEIVCWGNGGTNGERFEPPDGPWSMIRCGRDSCIAMDSAGGLGWWGSDTFAQLPSPEGVFLSADGSQTGDVCVIEESGSLRCWDELGTEWQPLTGVFKLVSLGADLGCAVDSAGLASCWSSNPWASSWGVDDPPNEVWVQMDIHTALGCGITATEQVVCWGFPEGGANGQETIEAPAGAFRDVATGSLFTCGVTTDQEMLCWGRDQVGQSSPP